MQFIRLNSSYHVNIVPDECRFPLCCKPGKTKGLACFHRCNSDMTIDAIDQRHYFHIKKCVGRKNSIAICQSGFERLFWVED